MTDTDATKLPGLDPAALDQACQVVIEMTCRMGFPDAFMRNMIGAAILKYMDAQAGRGEGVGVTEDIANRDPRITAAEAERDRRWKEGIADACGCPINFYPLDKHGLKVPPPTLGEFIRQLRALAQPAAPAKLCDTGYATNAVNLSHNERAGADAVQVPRALIDAAWSLLMQGGGKCCNETADGLYPFTTSALRAIGRGDRT